MKKEQTIKNELAKYIKDMLGNLGSDKQDGIHFVRLLDANFDLITKSVVDFGFSNKYDSLGVVNIRFIETPYITIDEDGDEFIKEGIALYITDGNGQTRDRLISRTYNTVDYMHYTDAEIDKLAKDLKDKYLNMNVKLGENYVQMSYGEYKNKYSANKTLKNSYDAVTKTICVLIN